jgi:hypothetical protein
MSINSLRPSTQFTIEVKPNSMILFLDTLVHWKGPALVTKVHRKLTLATASFIILTICCM